MEKRKLIYSGCISALFALCVIGFFAPEADSEEELNSDNWGEKVGFKPDLSVAEIKSGKKIKEKNADEYAKVLPASVVDWIKKYGLEIKLADYRPIHPSEGYIAATNKYRGQPKVLDNGNDVRKKGFDNYTAGLPFPSPKDGTEIAWNYQYSYNGDDGDLKYAVYWISANSGVEHFEEWRWYFIMRTLNRTDLDPKPAIDEFVAEGKQYTSITYAYYPYDKKGFGALFWRYNEPQDQQGHIYIPAMRRILRNSFGTRGDSWNSTDMLYEDVRGYMGYPEWMNWKLVEKKTMLMPMHANIPLGKENVKKVYDFDNKPHWNPKMEWELRPVYVVEATPKLSDYPYSKMVFYIDAETSLVTYKECYDKKGALWKLLLIGYNESPDMDEMPPTYGTQVVVDLQAEHATAFAIYDIKVNTNINPNEFTLANLRKRGR